MKKRTGGENPMEDEVLERNKNLNRGFRKLNVWREAVELYSFEKKCLDRLKSISFKNFFPSKYCFTETTSFFVSGDNGRPRLEIIPPTLKFKLILHEF